MKHYPERISIEVEFEGKKYSGEYYVENGMITVTSDYGGPTTTQAGPIPESIARQILREHLEGAKQRGFL